MWFWITLVLVFIIVLLWGICAGGSYNDDEDQIKYLDEWYKTHQRKKL